MSDPIRLELSNDEALVLFEWLCREGKKGSIPFSYTAEQVVLWGIEAQLERQLVEPFDPKYAELLVAARAKIDAG